MADVAKCLICDAFDVGTTSVLSSSGRDVTMRLCLKHERAFHLGVTGLLLKMKAHFYESELDGGLPEPKKEEPRG